MRTLLLLLLMTLTNLLFAQVEGQTCSKYTGIIDSSTNKILYTSADILPTFVDSTLDFTKFFIDNLKIPTNKCHNSIIKISFVVEPDGSITHQKIIEKPDCDITKEILDVLDIIPPMKPGKIKKATVPILLEYTITLPK